VVQPFKGWPPAEATPSENGSSTYLVKGRLVTLRPPTPLCRSGLPTARYAQALHLHLKFVIPVASPTRFAVIQCRCGLPRLEGASSRPCTDAFWRNLLSSGVHRMYATFHAHRIEEDAALPAGMVPRCQRVRRQIRRLCKHSCWRASGR
jgi:hypothetical protein